MGLPSILTLVKPDDFLKSHILKSINLQNYDEIEIEARIGRITSVITRKRVVLDTPHPVIFDSLSGEHYFDGGVDQQDFENMKNQIQDGCKVLSENGDSNLINTSDKIAISGKIRKIESEDSVIYEKKIRLKNIDIYLPGCKYDIRISLSREVRVDSKEFRGPVNLFRKRERQSLLVGPFSIDFTKVITRDSQKSFEIELEIKDNIKDSLEGFVNLMFNLSLIKK